jgi:cephalosporin hydroxylase
MKEYTHGFTLEEYKKYLTSSDNFEFFGLKMTQIPEALIRISTLLQIVKPDKIIEFGTGYGGLSVLLSLYCKIKNKSFVTYDAVLHRPDILDNLAIKDFRLKHLDYPETIAEITQEIEKESGKILLVCDAMKAEEAKLYAPKLKKEDILIIHDYSQVRNGPAFQNTCQKYGWTAPQEQWIENMKEFCEKDGIYPYFYKEMEDVLWFCGIKL